MTSTSANTVTPVDELQLAVQRLRCDHAFPIQPPHGSLAKPGPCKHCGLRYEASSPVADRMIKPLAALLEKTVKDYDEDVYEDEIGCNPGGTHGDFCEADCPGHKPVAICDRCGNHLDAPDPARCRCWDHPLAIARTINGGGA